MAPRKIVALRNQRRMFQEWQGDYRAEPEPLKYWDDSRAWPILLAGA